MSPTAELLTWMRRARPSRVTLIRALVTSIATQLSGIALLVGAPYLLVQSAATSQVVTASSLAISLVVIEILAFVRSPLRYAERRDTHELGLASVTQWRRWLLVTVGRWPYRRWRDAADGDLLERALTDTDELQDLWLRCVVPAITAVAATAIAIAIATAFPAGSVRLGWACVALVADLGVGALLLSTFLSPLVDAERHVRTSRAARTAALVDAHAIASEASLLRRSGFVQQRVDTMTREVTRCERHRDRLVRTLRASAALTPIGGLIFVSWIANVNQPAFGRADVIILLLGVVVFDAMAALRTTIEGAARVVIATERLDELSTPAPTGAQNWPRRARVSARRVTVRRDGTAVVNGIDLSLPPGSRVAITGPVGSGKSTLLRVLAGLDSADEGSVFADDVDLSTIADSSLREHLGYVGAAPRLTTGVASRVLRAGRDLDVDVAATMAPLGMEGDATTRWTSLSRGESMRVALARQLLGHPDVLFLDEPTSGLGPAERTLVLDVLRTYAGTLVCATHDADVVADCSVRMAMHDGEWASPPAM